MDGQGLRMCRFTRDGIPELGEYLESVDGTGICKLTELDGGGEEVVVCLPDGTMPEGISDLELVRVPTRIEDRDAFAELRRQVLRMNDAAWWIEHKNDAATMLAQDIEL